MQLESVYREILPKAYAMLPTSMRNPKADLMLLAIGLQESGFKTRIQIGGPARGFWQFEQGGGVKGVLTHPASRPYANKVCSDSGIAPTTATVYVNLSINDALAAAFARLLLWTDSQSIPSIGEVEASWQYYLRNWRPGKPHRKTWDGYYAQAMDCVREMEVPV